MEYDTLLKNIGTILADGFGFFRSKNEKPRIDFLVIWQCKGYCDDVMIDLYRLQKHKSREGHHTFL